MSLIILAIIFIVSILLVCFTFIFIEKRRKQKQESNFLKKFSELASKYGLSFSSQLVLKTCMVGLDAINMKMLILDEQEDKISRHRLVDLDEVRICRIKRIQGYYHQRGKFKFYHENMIREILLVIEFLNSNEILEINFFKEGRDDDSAIPELEQKAMTWDSLISQIIVPRSYAQAEEIRKPAGLN